jgi:hypothetical protein
MTDNCYSPYSVLSDIIRELDPNAPPAAPPDLLSTVSSVFHQRSERLRQEALARRDAEIEAGYVAAREARKKEKLEEELEEEEEISEEEWDEDEDDDEIPSKEDIEAFIDDMIDKEEKGPGLRRAIGEAQEDHRKRVGTLQDRIQRLQLFKFALEHEQGEPPKYVEGFPVNLVNAFCHLGPHIPVANAEMFDCLQCKVKGRRCSRSMNYSPACERCRRHGDPCLVKDLTYPVALCWWFARGQKTGDIEQVEIEWLERLVNKGKVEGIQALPVWPGVGDNSSNKSGEDEMPKKWQDFLKGSAKRKISRW